MREASKSRNDRNVHIADVHFRIVLVEFRGILGAALGVQKVILGVGKPILGMASQDLSNAKTTILGATLGEPTHQKIFICYFASCPERCCDYFFRICLGFSHRKMAGIFGVFLGSPFPTKRNTKTPQKLRGNFQAKFGAKTPKSPEKFRSATFLT